MYIIYRSCGVYSTSPGVDVPAVIATQLQLGCVLGARFFLAAIPVRGDVTGAPEEEDDVTSGAARRRNVTSTSAQKRRESA